MCKIEHDYKADALTVTPWLLIESDCRSGSGGWVGGWMDGWMRVKLCLWKLF